MSVIKPKYKNMIFFGIPMQSTAEARAPIAAKLDAFDKQKKALLSKLQSAHDRGPKTIPFDQHTSWSSLTSIAQLYFWQEVMKQETTPIRVRDQQLRQLKTALRHAHNLLNRAIEGDVGDDLFKAWFAKKALPMTAALQIEPDGSSVLTRTVEEIKGAIAGLATLEAAVGEATVTTDVPSKGGRPALLPRDCIQGLARVYRTSTGSKPGRGAGPFAEFVWAFATAVGKNDVVNESIIGAIKDAHRKSTLSLL